MLLQGIESARLAARRFLYSAGVENLEHVDVYAFADRLKIRVAVVPLAGALAQLVSNGRRTRLLISDRVVDPVLRRAAVAHELGHYILDHPAEATERLCSPTIPIAPVPSPGSPRDYEAEANMFALELLAPSCAVEKLCRGYAPSIALCSRVALATWVPLDYAAVRIMEITDLACATIVSRGHQIAYAVPSRRFSMHLGAAFERRLQPGAPIDPRTLAARLVDRSMPQHAAEVPSSAWLDIDQIPLLEDSAPLACMDNTITILRAVQLDELVRARTRRFRTEHAYMIRARGTRTSAA